MKIALCFIISYNHELKKEALWKNWIESNKDIINVYFHYKDYSKITSTWIRVHALPKNKIVNTSYFHVVPAYISLLSHAHSHDKNNQWFCFLTDSCAPIISPQKFRQLFFANHRQSIMPWKRAWWNEYIHKRANLRYLAEEYRLGNDPWFVLTRIDVESCLRYTITRNNQYEFICKGGLANESIFAIMLKSYNRLNNVKNEITHLADWTRMTSATSPYVFKNGPGPTIQNDIVYIENNKAMHPYLMFLRKVDSDFPDRMLIYLMMDSENDVPSLSSYTTIMPEKSINYMSLWNDINNQRTMNWIYKTILSTMIYFIGRIFVVLVFVGGAIWLIQS